MKTLYLVRHAKSSWKDTKLRDFERPLNKRGLNDAPLMGKVLRKMNIKPELIISSPAKRTLDTAEYFCEKLDFPFEDVIFDDDFYNCSINNLLKEIQNQNDEINSVMIFAHNPGLTDLHNFLCEEYIDNIPTAGISILNFDSENWEDLKEKSCKLESFEFPNKYK